MKELEPFPFTVVSVAVQESTVGLDDFVKDVTFPVLIDREHLLTELFAISNVPTVLWIDEHDRIVRPNSVAFGTDTFREFTGIDAEVHKNLIRAWVRGDGDAPSAAGSDPGNDTEIVVGDLTPDEVSARLHYRIALHLHRKDDADGAAEHFARAAELAPHDFTIRRAAMPLIGQDPFGDEFFALYAEWEKAGSPYHGQLASRTDPKSG